MSNALVARLPFGLLSIQLLSHLTSCALVGRDCCWPADRCYNSLPAMSMPSWRDRHSACHLNNIHIYLVARPQSRALVGRDRCWLAPHPSLLQPAVSFSWYRAWAISYLTLGGTPLELVYQFGSTFWPAITLCSSSAAMWYKIKEGCVRPILVH